MTAILQFLIAHFPDLLAVNLTASIVIVFVLLARQLLKRAPKVFSYALWGIVLLRLLVPFSIESPVSLVPEQREFSYAAEVNEVLPELTFETPADRAENKWRRENTPPGEPFTQVSRSLNAQTYLTVIWLFGIAVLLLRSLVSYGKLRRKLKVVVPFRKGIFLADDIDTPFVMGLFRPTIYLPGTLDGRERKYIIAHERHHIRRGDHIIKALSFLALTVHWFNPLVWMAFLLASRDMEMSCDEAVIRRLGEEVRADYSASLLNLATGYRLFAGTPLAFGEGDPTGRVRNLARWKKPALWVTVICMVLCMVLAVCLLTNRGTDAPDGPQIQETQAAVPAQTHPPELSDWGVSIQPDRVSSTGATALFRYSGSVPGEEGAELTYGDFLSLDRLVDGSWVPCDELAGYEYYVGDASYPVVDGYGMVHEWPKRFGQLPDGHYRIGKQVTLVRPDGSSESRMAYGEFTLPDSVRTGLIPLEELPEIYSGEQAMLDGCFVTEDGTARENKDLFREFAENSRKGMPGVIRIVNWHYGEDSRWSAMDLRFDGSVYTLSNLENTYTFQYLNRYTGEKAWEGAEHDAFELYVLVNDETITVEDIYSGKLDMSDWRNPAHWTVFADFRYDPKRPQLPDKANYAVLELAGSGLLTVTNAERLEKLEYLFESGELLGYEPKTHNIGVGLNLVIVAGEEETVIELDPESDLCRIDGEYVWYGRADEPEYIYQLWEYLGITQWPDLVYMVCENALRGE